jgi:hypothetical protein
MRTLALGLAGSSAVVVALAWIARPVAIPSSPAPSVAERAPDVTVFPAAVSERVEVAPNAPMTLAAPAATAKLAYDPSEWLVPQNAAVLAPADPFGAARTYFHAQVRVEQLASELPPDVDRANVPSALYPEYAAAAEDATQLYTAFAAIQPPTASEPLPSLDLWAKDEALAGIYRGASREELLFEDWRIQRAAYAESKRILDQRLLDGPYEVTRSGGPMVEA